MDDLNLTEKLNQLDSKFNKINQMGMDEISGELSLKRKDFKKIPDSSMERKSSISYAYKSDQSKNKISISDYQKDYRTSRDQYEDKENMKNL